MQVRGGVGSFLSVTGTIVFGVLVGACSLLEPEDGNSVPEITLKGNAVDTIGIGRSYIDSGAVATDEEDGDLTSSINVTGSVDTSTEGTYTLTYSVQDSEGESASVTRTVYVVDNTISLGTPDCPAVFDCTTVSYKIASTFTIPEGCTVTFGPNTRVEMTDNIVVNGELIIKEAARFLVDEGVILDVNKGKLTIAGADTAKVRFGNYSPGAYWGRGDDNSGMYARYGIRFGSSANATSSIDHCVIDSATVGIRVEKDEISITNSTFSNCAYGGLYFDGVGPADSASFVANTFTGNGKTETYLPLYIDAAHLGRLSGTSVFSNNARDAVGVEGGGDISETGSWKKLDVPYVFREYKTIDNADGVVITIRPGARFEFLEGEYLSVNNGTLVAEGTVEDSISFRGHEAGKYWGKGGDESGWYDRFGLRIESNANANTTLKYCRFDSATVGLRCEQDEITVSHCRFSNSAYAGLYFSGSGPKDSSSFVNNVFVGNGKSATFFPLYLESSYLSRLSGTSVFNGNAVDAVAVEDAEEISETGSWKKLDVPYVFRDYSTINNPDGVVITMRPGLRLQFLEGKHLSVNNGTLIAEGTADDSISFENFEGGKYWGKGGDESGWYDRYGLRIESNANANTTLKYCRFDSATVGLRCEQDGITVSDCRFSNSAYAGIYFSAAGPKDSSSFVNNAFTGNGKSASYFPLYLESSYLSRLSGTSVFGGNAVDAVAVEDAEEISESGSWKKLEVPYVFRDYSTINNVDGVVITIRPGARFRFLQDMYLRVNNGTLIAEGTVGDSIRFSNYVGGKYWGKGGLNSGLYDCYGIAFTENANPNSSVKYCAIDSAVVGVNIDEAPVKVSHCTIRDCQRHGMYTYGAGNTNVDDATITFVNNGESPDHLHEE